MIQNAPMRKQDLLNVLSQYNKSDLAHVIKHSKGIWYDSATGLVEYREWAYPDVEMDVGV